MLMVLRVSVAVVCVYIQLEKNGVFLIVLFD